MSLRALRTSNSSSGGLSPLLGCAIGDGAAVFNVEFELQREGTATLRLASFLLSDPKGAVPEERLQALDAAMKNGQLVFVLYRNPAIMMFRYDISTCTVEIASPEFWSAAAHASPTVPGTVEVRMAARGDGLWTAEVSHRIGAAARVTHHIQKPNKWEFSYVGSNGP